jgi:hypothetical protein
MSDQIKFTANPVSAVRRPSMEFKRPGVWGATGPKYPGVMASLNRLVQMSPADLPTQKYS